MTSDYYGTTAAAETSKPRPDNTEMTGTEAGAMSVGLFSVKSHFKDEIAKQEKGSEIADIHSMDEFEKCLKDPDNKVPVYPLLVTVTGMSKTQKTESLEKSFKPLESKPQNERFSHHEFFISMFPSTEIFPVARDESFLRGIQSGLKFCLKNVSIADLSSTTNQCRSLVALKEIAKFINSESKIVDHGETSQSLSTSNKQTQTSKKKFDLLLTHGIGFLNMWDTSFNNKTIRPILELFGDCFTRSNLWLFVDLDDDIDTLNLSPSGSDSDSKALRFRSQLVYLLRQCQLCIESKYQDDTHKVCTIFATYTESPSLFDPEEKKNDLRGQLEEAARQMGVDDLIDFKIVLIDKKAKSSRDLKSKLGKALNRIPPKRIPLSWLYLRHCLACCNEFCITRTKLDQMSAQCGLPQCADEYDLQEFLIFFTSFGSILDMKKFNPEYVIIKPYEFLLCCDKILRSVNHSNGTVDINEQTAADGLCITLMVSIGMGTKMRLTQNMYYFPTIRTGERKRTIDTFAVQFVTSMSSPPMQKPVSIIEALQSNLRNAEIQHLQSTLENRTNTAVISTRQDGLDQMPLNIFLSFQGNVVEMFLYKKDEHHAAHATGETLQTAVEQMVSAFHAVAEKKSLSRCKVRYHFAVRCQQNEDDSIEYYPYHKRHVLPQKKFCKQCLESGIEKDPFIKAWIAALEKNNVPNLVKLNGDLLVHDLSNVVEKVSQWPTDAIQMFSMELGKDVEDYYQEQKDKKSSMWLVLGMLQTWQGNLDKEDESPKNVLARVLEAVDKKFGETNESFFGKLAQKIDMQVLTERQKELLKKRKASAQLQ